VPMLREAGRTAVQLKEGGFSAVELDAACFTQEELEEAGFFFGEMPHAMRKELAAEQAAKKAEHSAKEVVQKTLDDIATARDEATAKRETMKEASEKRRLIKEDQLGARRSELMSKMSEEEQRIWSEEEAEAWEQITMEELEFGTSEDPALLEYRDLSKQEETLRVEIEAAAAKSSELELRRSAEELTVKAMAEEAARCDIEAESKRQDAVKATQEREQFEERIRTALQDANAMAVRVRKEVERKLAQTREEVNATISQQVKEAKQAEVERQGILGKRLQSELEHRVLEAGRLNRQAQEVETLAQEAQARLQKALADESDVAEELAKAKKKMVSLKLKASTAASNQEGEQVEQTALAAPVPTASTTDGNDESDQAERTASSSRPTTNRDEVDRSKEMAEAAERVAECEERQCALQVVAEQMRMEADSRAKEAEAALRMAQAATAAREEVQSEEQACTRRALTLQAEATVAAEKESASTKVADAIKLEVEQISKQVEGLRTEDKQARRQRDLLLAQMVQEATNQEAERHEIFHQQLKSEKERLQVLASSAAQTREEAKASISEIEAKLASPHTRIKVNADDLKEQASQQAKQLQHAVSAEEQLKAAIDELAKKEETLQERAAILAEEAARVEERVQTAGEEAVAAEKAAAALRQELDLTQPSSEILAQEDEKQMQELKAELASARAHESAMALAAQQLQTNLDEASTKGKRDLGLLRRAVAELKRQHTDAASEATKAADAVKALAAVEVAHLAEVEAAHAAKRKLDAEAEEKRLAFEEASEKAKLDVVHLRAEVERLNEQIEEMRQSMADRMNTHAEQRQYQAKLATAVIVAEQRKTEAADAATAAQQAVASATEGAMNRLKDQMDSLKKRMEEQRAEGDRKVAELSRTVDELQTEKIDGQVRLEAAEAIKQDALAKVLAEKAEVQQISDAKDVTIASMKAALQAAVNKEMQTAEESALARQEVQTKLIELNAWQNQVTMLKEQLEEVNQKYLESAGQVHKEISNSADIVRELQAAKEEWMKLHASLQQKEAESHDHSEAAEEAKGKIVVLDIELASAKEKHATQQKELEAALEFLIDSDEREEGLHAALAAFKANEEKATDAAKAKAQADAAQALEARKLAESNAKAAAAEAEKSKQATAKKAAEAAKRAHQAQHDQKQAKQLFEAKAKQAVEDIEKAGAGAKIAAQNAAREAEAERRAARKEVEEKAKAAQQAIDVVLDGSVDKAAQVAAQAEEARAAAKQEAEKKQLLAKQDLQRAKEAAAAAAVAADEGRVAESVAAREKIQAELVAVEAEVAKARQLVEEARQRGEGVIEERDAAVAAALAADQAKKAGDEMLETEVATQAKELVEKDAAAAAAVKAALEELEEAYQHNGVFEAAAQAARASARATEESKEARRRAAEENEVAKANEIKRLEQLDRKALVDGVMKEHGEQLPLVSVDLPKRELTLKQQVAFVSKRSVLKNPKTATSIFRQLALVVSQLDKALTESGKSPTYISFQGHGAQLGKLAEALSSDRARTVWREFLNAYGEIIGRAPFVYGCGLVDDEGKPKNPSDYECRFVFEGYGNLIPDPNGGDARRVSITLVDEEFCRNWAQRFLPGERRVEEYPYKGMDGAHDAFDLVDDRFSEATAALMNLTDD